MIPVAELFISIALLRHGIAEDVLMCVDDGGKIDFASLSSLLQNRGNPTHCQLSCLIETPMGLISYSGGFAGSMITASLVLSSTTRYA